MAAESICNDKVGITASLYFAPVARARFCPDRCLERTQIRQTLAGLDESIVDRWTSLNPWCFDLPCAESPAKGMMFASSYHATMRELFNTWCRFTQHKGHESWDTRHFSTSCKVLIHLKLILIWLNPTLPFIKFTDCIWKTALAPNVTFHQILRLCSLWNPSPLLSKHAPFGGALTEGLAQSR